MSNKPAKRIKVNGHTYRLAGPSTDLEALARATAKVSEAFKAFDKLVRDVPLDNDARAAYDNLKAQLQSLKNMQGVA